MINANRASADDLYSFELNGCRIGFRIRNGIQINVPIVNKIGPRIAPCLK